MECLSITHGVHQMSVDFASTLEHVDAAVHALMVFIQQQQIPYEPFDLELVLREALTNAVRHGNHLDAARLVRCAMQVDQDILQITVTDEGEGFDWQQQLQEPRLDSPGGRGGWLMQLYGFEVTYNPAGNVLCLSKPFDHPIAGDMV
jgi:serine/threonine-protein kinase RsbW